MARSEYNTLFIVLVSAWDFDNEMETNQVLITWSAWDNILVNTIGM